MFDVPTGTPNTSKATYRKVSVLPAAWGGTGAPIVSLELVDLKAALDENTDKCQRP